MELPDTWIKEFYVGFFNLFILSLKTHTHKNKKDQVPNYFSCLGE